MDDRLIYLCHKKTTPYPSLRDVIYELHHNNERTNLQIKGRINKIRLQNLKLCNIGN